MNLTPQQLATLKAAINGNPTWAAFPNTTDGHIDLAVLLSNTLTSSPAVIVWRNSVSLDEITQNGFDWVRVDNLSVGKARIWEWMFKNSASTFNPSKANVRAGIEECWNTAANAAIRAAIYVHCKRTATLAEAIFATGSGSDASPSTMGFEGALSPADVAAARALP